MKKPLLFACAASLIWLSLYNCTHAGKGVSLNSPGNTQNILASYGEYLYQREKCGNCHTLQQQQVKDKIVSLDGLGGKYPASWHYYMLANPKMLIPGATMPAFRHLKDQPLKQQHLQKLKLTGNPASRWAALISQADSLSRLIRDQGATAENRTEVLALIAFLQQIPSSPAKKKADSLAEKERLQQLEFSFEVAKDTILQMAQNKNNVPAGAHTFKGLCSVCHGQQGGGVIGPNLTDEYWLHGGSPVEIANTIFHGVPEKGMIAWRHHLTPKEIGELVAYIVSIQGTNPEYARGPQGVKE